MLTKIKSGACHFGNAVLDATTAMHNATLQNQINELDEQAAALRKQLMSIEEQKSELKAKKI